MSEHFEQDPKKVESLRMQVDSLIQNYLNQKPTPGIADFAEAFGAEAYVVEMKKQRAVKVDIKAFREEIVERLLTQAKVTGTEVILPKVFEMLSQTILPPDEGEIKTGSSEGVEKKKYIPRTQYLIELLSQMGEQYEIIGGKNTSDMMRERTYFIFHLPNSEKAVFVNNEEGNTTFIIYQIESKQQAIDLAALTKDEIRAKELHSHPYAQIDWTGDGEGWKGKMLGYLTGLLPENKQKKESSVISGRQENENSVYEKAPEGWLTINAIAKKIGKDKTWAENRIKNLIVTQTQWQPKMYSMHSGGKNALHYPLELVLELQKQVDSLEKAPEGWLTPVGISKKIDKERIWIFPRIKKILEQHPEWSPKNYVGAGNVEALHYPPELIIKLELEVGGLIEAPEGWMPLGAIANNLGKDYSWVERRVIMLCKEHPEWEGKMYLNPTQQSFLHYPPELILELSKELGKIKNKPDLWMGKFEIARKLNKSQRWVENHVDALLKLHPDWKSELFLDSGNNTLCYPPEMVEALEKDARLIKTEAKDNEFTVGKMAVLIGTTNYWIEKNIPPLLEAHPEWKSDEQKLSKTGNKRDFYSLEVLNALKAEFESREEIPIDWLSVTNIALLFNRSPQSIKKIVDVLIEEFPQWKPKKGKKKMNIMAWYYPPELVTEVKKVLEREVS